MDAISIALLIVVGIGSGFLNIMAGGGSTFTLPLLIFLGMDTALANGTNRIAILIQNLSGVTSFHRQEYSEFSHSFKLSLWTLPGAIVGAVLAIRISDELFETILGIVIIGIIITMFVSPTGGKSYKSHTAARSKWIYPAMLFTGLYGGFVQVGVGFVLMASLYHILKVNLIRVNMHKVFIVLMYTIPVIVVFVLADKVHWVAGLILGAGNAVGAWWSARVSVKKGDKAIRMVLVVAMGLIALKLIGLY
jgi:uncharacterized membrane protein YfcA